MLLILSLPRYILIARGVTQTPRDMIGKVNSHESARSAHAVKGGLSYSLTRGTGGAIACPPEYSCTSHAAALTSGEPSRKRLAVIALAVATILASAFATPRNKYNVPVRATDAVEQRLLHVIRITGLASSLLLVVDLSVTVAHKRFSLIFRSSKREGKKCSPRRRRVVPQSR